MFRSCIYCRRRLPTNDVLADFPVGRRLAFDGARGRLWVVCTACGRWNLSPLEARWEAIEACERMYGAARRRVTSDNVGLASVDGLDLVRIGRPRRPEMAAWRYGRNFLSRRRRHQLESWIPSGTIFVGSMLALPIFWPIAVGGWAVEARRARRVLGRIRDDQGGDRLLLPKHARDIRLVESNAAEGWALHVRHAGDVIELKGADAVRMAGVLLPHINRKGADADRVDRAVAEIERAGGPDRFFRAAAGAVRWHDDNALWPREALRGRVSRAPLELRLALEMAAHEDAEQRALEGELGTLEAAWREAEEVAAIADSLLLPKSVKAALQRIRHTAGTHGRGRAPDGPAGGAGGAGG